MRLKGIETKRNLAAGRYACTPRVSSKWAHFDGQNRNAERGPMEVRGRFENAFRNAPIGMAPIDMDGRWLPVNDALCRITGYAESELKTSTLSSLPHPDDIDLDVSLLRQLLDGKAPIY
jgi:PAS domain-containing protein